MNASKLRIAFNVSCMHPMGAGGWSRYTGNLIRSLKLYYGDQVEIFEFWNKERQSHTIWEQVSLPLLCKKNKIDLLHCPANGGAPLVLGIPTVMTVHDLFSEEKFSWLPKNNIKDFKSAIRYKLDWKISLNKAKRLIAVSKYTQDELVKYGVDKDKIDIVYEAVEEVFSPAKPPFRSHKKDAYLLYVGSDDERKRLSYLVSQYMKSSIELELVIVAKLRKTQIPKVANITVYEGLDDESLAQLYSNAFSFVIFSEKEGFGLPILEAMSCACPVIYDGSGAESELVGTFGIHAKGNLSSALEFLKQNGNKSKASKALLERSKQYSWKKVADETMAVYRQVLIDKVRSLTTDE